MFELVKTATKDNLYLHGLFKKGEKSKYAVIHIHGFEGNFYINSFIPVLAHALKDNSHSFLSVETRGTGGETVFSTVDDDEKRLGSYYEILKQAYMDIDAWVEFLVERGYKNIILQGHSLGTLKIVRYLAEGSNIKFVNKIILLSPFDGIDLIQKYTQNKLQDYLKIAKEKIQKDEGDHFVPPHFSDIKMTYQTYASWYTLDHFGRMFNFADKDNNFMLLNKLLVPVKVIVGRNDDFFYPSNFSDPEKAIDILKLNVKNFDYEIIDDAGHTYRNKEHELALSVLHFLEK